MAPTREQHLKLEVQPSVDKAGGRKDGRRQKGAASRMGKQGAQFFAGLLAEYAVARTFFFHTDNTVPHSTYDGCHLFVIMPINISVHI